MTGKPHLVRALAKSANSGSKATDVLVGDVANAPLEQLLTSNGNHFFLSRKL